MKKKLGIFALISAMILVIVAFAYWKLKGRDNETGIVIEEATRLDCQKISEEQTQEPTSESESQETRRVYLDVNNILQNPELPTGCEAVSATIVLNYYGANMSKTELVDEYLPYSDDPNQGFCGGTPYDKSDGSDMQWVAAAPIATAMNQALVAHGMNYTAKDISGTSFENVLTYVKNGHPVVFWALENMSRGSHTLVLMGYDLDAGVCYFADPMKEGIQAYSVDSTRYAYNTRGQYAVVVE
jgi:uncharacterized protein YvpB